MSEAMMRAKLQVSMVFDHFSDDYNKGVERVKTHETLTFHAVCKATYDATGLDEDNTFAKWTPGATMTICVANPDLWGKFTHGDKFYVDFTKAEN